MWSPKVWYTVSRLGEFSVQEGDGGEVAACHHGFNPRRGGVPLNVL